MPDRNPASPVAPLELYVYYRSRPESAEALGAAVRAMQRRLQADCPGLGTRWLRRPDLREGCVTWMEVYTLPKGTSSEAAEALVVAVDQAAAALAPWQIGERKVERFLDALAVLFPHGSSTPQRGG